MLSVSVAVTVLLVEPAVGGGPVMWPPLAVSWSYATVVVVSPVSMCSQNVRLAVQPAGTLTDWDSVSVWPLPYPSSQATNEPEWAAWPEEALLTTPEVAVQGAVPDS